MFKKSFFRFIILSALLFGSCTTDNYNKSSEDQIFQTVHGSPDIPLEKNLVINEDNIINFDSLNGNIISISYSTKYDLKKTKNFYLKTLPQMGWKVVANEFLDAGDILYFKRDRETLEIEFIENNQEKLVKFFGKLDN